MHRLLALAALFSLPLLPAAASVAVTTYHNDTYRSGWNSGETTLTAANAGSLQLQQQVALDAQAETQPLLVPGVNLGSAGTHDVVYVATANNTLYGIDAESGAVLLQRNFGTPVAQSALPGACGNNAATVGITSTPVIDPATNTLYLIAYLAGSPPSYQVHAVDITTLADKVTPQTIAATAKLAGGEDYHFQAAVTRQRTALLESGGNIYAGFASFCDFDARSSRGWVLGWNAATLAPMAGTALQDRLFQSADNEFLNAVWMSGYGIAADRLGNLYFSTSNSDKSGKSWNAKFNLSESVIKLSHNLVNVLSWFTPVGPVYGQAHDDESDGDFGSGGVMLVPEDGASGMHLAVTAGKTSPVIVLDRDAMGGRGKFLASAPSGGCWCGPSFFIGSDGIGRVVLSTGANVQVYQIQTTPSVALINPVKAALVTGQDGGFFTSVSSRNLVAGTAVVWAVTRPVSPNPGTIQLVAISPATGATLLRTPAGTWPNNGANANLVPTVANGHVYVASYKNLSIFGLGTGGRAIAFQPPAAPEPAALLGHEVSGIIETISSGRMTLRLRDNRVVDVDDARAAAEGLTFPLSPGAAATVMGGYRGNTLVARAIQHAKPFALNWPADR